MSSPADSRSQHDPGSHRGARHRRLVLSDYVGESAANAAQAIRRAGLRPGLERSLGCEADAIGRVLAQEPPAGSELARNAVVTLYVGAPGASPARDEPDDLEATDAGQPPQTPAEGTPLGPGEPQALPPARRRRKPRPPRPELAGVARGAGPTQQWTRQADIAPSDGPHHDEPHHEGLAHAEEDELPPDELVTHADDVLAGRAGSPWRRAYPSRRQLSRQLAGFTPHVHQHHRRSTQ